MNNPKISVLMPNYNCEKYIWEAIESILKQTFTDFEFIIIDDYSTDNSWEIIQNFAKKDERIIAIKNNKNLKICKTLNKWLKIAKWEYIARMDSDDISFIDRFQKQIKFLEKNLKVGIIGGSIEIIDEKNKKIGERHYNITDENIRKKIFRYSPFCHPTIMIRRDILEKSWNYDEEQVFAEDYDLYFRIGKYSQFANLTDFLLKYRMSSTNSTSKKLWEMEQKTLKIRKKALKEYWYTMTIFDKIYYYCQYLSMFIIPKKLKIFLFNLFR